MQAGFDTQLLGTDERQWRKLLVGSYPLRLQSGPIVVVAPHPDDETLGAGGLLASHSRARVIVVTDGEAADPGNPMLASQRRSELQTAVSCLSRRPIRVTHLALPDGEVARYQDRLKKLLQPHLIPGVTLVAPYEKDGHPDHDAVGRVCIGLAHRYRLPLLRYLIWGWHQQSPAAFTARRFARLALSARTRQAKRRAVSCFATQLRGGRHAVLPPHLLDYFQRPFEAYLT